MPLSNEGKYGIYLFHLPCSCTNCLHKPLKVTSCLYLNDQNWQKVNIEEKINEQPGIDYSEFTLNELKDILCNRDLPFSGRKDELIEQLQKDNQNNNTIVGNRGGDNNKTNNNDKDKTNSENKEDELSTDDEEEDL